MGYSENYDIYPLDEIDPDDVVIMNWATICLVTVDITMKMYLKWKLETTRMHSISIF